MIALLKGVSLKAWGYILAGLVFAAALLKAYSAGRTAERAATNEKNLEVKDAQLEAAARGPRDRDDLVKRMRSNQF